MPFSSVLRRSASRAAPLLARAIGSHPPIHSSSGSAVKRAAATISPESAPAVLSWVRKFGTTRPSSYPSSDNKLVQVLQSEVDVVEQSGDFDKTVDAPNNFPFRIQDNVGEQTVTLTREYEGEIITVEVSMPNLVTGEEDEDEDQDDDEEASSESTVPLLVLIAKKNGQGSYLEFDCSAFPDEIRINSLSLKNPESEDQLAYEGPDFLDLDENLQKAFHKYLEMRGIKPSATNFLHEYMIEKDNKEYLRWLKNVKKFVEA